MALHEGGSAARLRLAVKKKAAELNSSRLLPPSLGQRERGHFAMRKNNHRTAREFRANLCFYLLFSSDGNRWAATLFFVKASRPVWVGA
jgi:hypothetical protein